MIVFNLACAADHRFEGWFASADDFASQHERGLLSCPVCGSAQVQKQLSAPRLNLSFHGTDEGASQGDAKVPAPAQGVAMVDAKQRELLELVRRIVESTEDVGQRFPEEARRIHYNESPARAIRGVASAEEAKSLVEEGIEVAHLPLPALGKSQLN